MELKPEERAKIYAEEKARVEIREKLKREKPAGAGWFIGAVLLSLFLVVLVAGFIVRASESDADRAKTDASNCMHASQLRYAEKNLSYQDGLTAAAIECSAELTRLRQTEGDGK